MQNSEKIWQLVDARKDAYEALSDRVWGMPEIAYTEYRSVAEHRAMLEQRGLPRHRERRRHPDRGDGRGGRGRPGDRHPRRIRRAAGPRQEAGIAEPTAGRARRPRPWLRPQPARLGGAARRDRGEELARRRPASRAACATTAARPRKAAPPRPSWCAPAPSTMSTSPSPGIPAAFTGVDEALSARQHAHRLHLHRPRLACRRRAASRPQRARCGRADECRRQLHARAHAVATRASTTPCSMPAASRRTSCRPTPRCATSIRARDLPGMHALIERVRKIAEGAALMTETKVEIAGRQRGLQPARQHAAGAGDAATARAPRARRRSTRRTATMRPRSRRR